RAAGAATATAATPRRSRGRSPLPCTPRPMAPRGFGFPLASPESYLTPRFTHIPEAAITQGDANPRRFLLTASWQKCHRLGERRRCLGSPRRGGQDLALVEHRSGRRAGG